MHIKPNSSKGKRNVEGFNSTGHVMFENDEQKNVLRPNFDNPMLRDIPYVRHDFQVKTTKNVLANSKFKIILPHILELDLNSRKGSRDKSLEEINSDLQKQRFT